MKAIDNNRAGQGNSPDSTCVQRDAGFCDKIGDFDKNRKGKKADCGLKTREAEDISAYCGLKTREAGDTDHVDTGDTRGWRHIRLLRIEDTLR